MRCARRRLDQGEWKAGSQLNITHHFSEGVYIKETAFDKGEEVPMHEHVHGHFSVLSRGWVVLTVDGESREVRAGTVLTIEAGKHHTVRALTQATWLCIHATDETDAANIDETLVG